jgi:hypothetical protein
MLRYTHEVINLQPGNKAARAALVKMKKELKSYNKKSAKIGKHVFEKVRAEHACRDACRDACIHACRYACIHTCV